MKKKKKKVPTCADSVYTSSSLPPSLADIVKLGSRKEAESAVWDVLDFEVKEGCVSTLGRWLLCLRPHTVFIMKLTGSQ